MEESSLPVCMKFGAACRPETEEPSMKDPALASSSRLGGAVISDRVVASLLEELTNGRYAQADRLPAEVDLATELALEVGEEVICIKKRILADTTPVIYSIDYLPRSLFGNRDYTRIDLTGDIFEILEQECHQQISSNVAHLKASCGDEAIRAAMRLAPGEAMLLLDEVCFNRLCRPVMRSLSYYTNFFDFSILRKLL